MSRRKSRKVSAEELGFRVVELPRPRERVQEPAPSSCPECALPLEEVATNESEMDTGDGHTYVDVRRRRGLCPSCGWVDV